MILLTWNYFPLLLTKLTVKEAILSLTLAIFVVLIHLTDLDDDISTNKILFFVQYWLLVVAIFDGIQIPAFNIPRFQTKWIEVLHFK